MSKLSWYWHRLRAMSPAEVILRVRGKWRETADARRQFAATGLAFEPVGNVPKLPGRAAAPAVVRDSLRREADHLLAGHWRAFGHLDLKVDDPPRWQCDYLVGRDLATNASAFSLDHRSLPAGADSKVIWELSRWHPLVQLAMAAYLLSDTRASAKCVAWLEDWVEQNPPYRGWNWTSALEAGLRLIQFAWIDALLLHAPETDAALRGRLAALRARLLPAHVWFTWRHRSFGSSANNHLLGELAGLIIARARWAGLDRWLPPIKKLRALWEKEVLRQFAPDGGNREQALNYHLFSWELCWQTMLALVEARYPASMNIQRHLKTALRFFWEVQASRETWDYGDSDDAFVTPLFVNAQQRVPEWRDWASGSATGGTGIGYWLGEAPWTGVRFGRGQPERTDEIRGWWVYPDSGIALQESGFWWLRWDLSPLGYGRTAAHGHLDSLHLSIWYRRQPLVVDPGTGAYFADPRLREWLASRAAHNGPCPLKPTRPRRLGPFLWSQQHGRASIQGLGRAAIEAVNLGFLRRITRLEKSDGWRVEDGPAIWIFSRPAFSVHWQFAPGCWVKRISSHQFSLHRADVSVMIDVDKRWDSVELVELPAMPEGRSPVDLDSLPGLVSPAFRRVVRAPYLKLTARQPNAESCLFHTTFQPSRAT